MSPSLGPPRQLPPQPHLPGPCVWWGNRSGNQAAPTQPEVTLLHRTPHYTRARPWAGCWEGS